jgi:hypothetical protein
MRSVCGSHVSFFRNIMIEPCVGPFAPWCKYTHKHYKQ